MATQCPDRMLSSWEDTQMPRKNAVKLRGYTLPRENAIKLRGYTVSRQNTIQQRQWISSGLTIHKQIYKAAKKDVSNILFVQKQSPPCIQKWVKVPFVNRYLTELKKHTPALGKWSFSDTSEICCQTQI